ncbi:hypothetical protein ACFLTH_03370 [Bacteroidota bacterium]
MRNQSLLTSLIIFMVLSINLTAQEESSEKWVLIKKDANSRLYLDIHGLKDLQGNDIYIWTREYYDPPRIIETINGKIYNAKTYYLINKEIKKYSILQIIYYDENNNLIKDFIYDRNSDIEEYKYNYPILLDSDMDLIFEECLKYFWNTED